LIRWFRALGQSSLDIDTGSASLRKTDAATGEISRPAFSYGSEFIEIR
jgi:hypothetical protein